MVVVNYYVPYSLVNKMKEISTSFEQFKNTKFLKGKIQKGYVVVLLLIALVIIFLATWFGFHLARGITGPIQELAMATNRVAEGDLDVSIDVHSDDEIGSLVEAFNKMTADLRQGQQEIDQANRDLQASNLELDQRRRYMEIVLEKCHGRRHLRRQAGKSDHHQQVGGKTLAHQDRQRSWARNFREVVGCRTSADDQGFLARLMDSGKDSIRKQVTLPLQDDKLTLLVNVTHPAGRKR